MHLGIALPSLLMLATPALALDIHHCPTPERIKATQGLYTSSNTQKSRWVGALPNEEPAPITTFVKAVYFATGQSGADKGILAKCLYRTSTDKLVDLRFLPNSQQEATVKLLDLKNWKQQFHESGLTQYICTSSQEGGCVFAAIPPTVSRE